MPRRKRDEYIQDAEQEIAIGRRPGSYPLTIPEWIDMYQDQNGKCKLCGSEMLNLSLCQMDHNHLTGKVRALVCGKCNVKLSNLCDDLDRLNKMIDYAKLGFWEDQE